MGECIDCAGQGCYRCAGEWPTSQPDPKDERIAELEAGQREQVRLRDEWRKSAEELLLERDQLRARVQELEREVKRLKGDAK